MHSRLFTCLHNMKKIKETYALETGFTDSNVWLQWIVHTAWNSKFSSSNCVTCAAARPGLGTVPLPLNPNNDPKGFRLMLELYKLDSATNCTTLKLLFPPVSPQIKPPWFTPYTENYTCLTWSKGTVSVGMLTTCKTIIDLIKGEFRVISTCSFVAQATLD